VRSVAPQNAHRLVRACRAVSGGVSHYLNIISVLTKCHLPSLQTMSYRPLTREIRRSYATIFRSFHFEHGFFTFALEDRRRTPREDSTSSLSSRVLPLLQF
jgi:hypothetical protein